MPTIEYRGLRYLLELNAAGEPKCLKRQVSADLGRSLWVIVWSDRHEKRPTGNHERAIEIMGFKHDQKKHRWVKLAD